MERFNSKIIVLIVVFGAIGAAGLNFITQVVISRALSVDAYGVFATLMPLIGACALAVNFGIPNYLLSKYSGVELDAFDYRTIRSTVRLTLISSFSVMILFIMATSDILAVNINKYESILFSTQVLFLASIELLLAINQIKFRYKNVAFIQLIYPLLRLIIVLIIYYFYQEEASLKVYLSAYSIVSILALTHLIMSTSSFKSLGLRVDFRPILKGSYNYFLAALTHLIYFQMNVFLVGIMLGSVEAAKYNVAFLLVSSSLLVCSALVNRYYMPIIHKMAIENSPDIYQIIRGLVIGLLLIGFFISAALAVGSDFLIRLIFTEKYMDSSQIMKILLLGLPFTFISSGVGAYLHTRNHIAGKVKIMTLVAVLNVFLVILFLPIFGSVAAAWVTLLCNMVLCALYCHAYFRLRLYV